MVWLMMAGKAFVFAIVVLILTEIAKRNSFASAVIIAFPLMTVLTMATLYFDTGNAARSYKLAYTTFWLILASTSFFGILFITQKIGLPFWGSFVGSIIGAVIAIFAITVVLRRFGIDLLSNV